MILLWIPTLLPCVQFSAPFKRLEIGEFSIVIDSAAETTTQRTAGMEVFLNKIYFASWCLYLLFIVIVVFCNQLFPATKFDFSI